MKGKVKIGILSTANIAVRSIIPAISELEDKFTLTCIASRSKQNADRIAKLFNITPFYSYKELLEESEIEAIYIPLPNSLHKEWVERALEKGLHVLVEKSMGCTFDEVRELNNLAKQKELALIENFQFRFHPQLSTILRLMHEGHIGEIRYMRSSFEFPPFKDRNNIRYNKLLGGGALLDAGAYPIKITQLILGNDLNVEAGVLNYDDTFDVDIWGGGFLKQRNGNAFSEITFGFDNFYQCSIELSGSEGKISTNRIFTSPPDYEPEIIVETKTGRKTITIEASNHFVKMLNYFFETICSRVLRENEYEENLNQARIIEEFKVKSNEK